MRRFIPLLTPPARRGTPLAIRASLGLLAGASLMGIAGQARAAGAADGPAHVAPEPVPSFAWGLRFNGSIGFASDPEANQLASASRIGVDAEYWLSRSVGIGAQLAFEYLSTIDGFGETYASSDTTRGAFAPAITVRGADPTSFPLASLALGYTLGTTATYVRCELGSIAGCQPDYGGTDSGPYASLSTAWLFHSGEVRPGSTVFAIGPLARLDVFSTDALIKYYWVVTAGVTLAWFGVANQASCAADSLKRDCAAPAGR
jgi:hypothetical protein